MWVGDDCRRAVAAEFEAGFRIISAQLANQVGEVLVVDAADTLQLRKGSLGDKIEMRDHRRHRGVVTVGLARLDRDTFGEVASADARRVEALDAREEAWKLVVLGKRGAVRLDLDDPRVIQNTNLYTITLILFSS